MKKMRLFLCPPLPFPPPSQMTQRETIKDKITKGKPLESLWCRNTTIAAPIKQWEAKNAERDSAKVSFRQRLHDLLRTHIYLINQIPKKTEN